MSLNNTPTKYIWFNGQLVNYADAKVHVLSHALHYGTAVFEGIRAYSTHAFSALMSTLTAYLTVPRFIASLFHIPRSKLSKHVALLLPITALSLAISVL